uniref:Ig-like domain-containing protein n=1 Tax=Poecilia formosa TaxID=48698 RepID=A0A087YIU2_POEFO
MSFSAATGFVVLFLSVTVGQDEPAWSVKYDRSQICALRGSTVMIKCSYTYPSSVDGRNAEVKTRFWFTKGNNQVPVDLEKDSDYKSRITYESTESSSILTIKDLKQRDSAEYKFRFITNQPGGAFTGSPGVTLTVLDLRVQVRRSETQTELKCESSCDLTKPPSYVWFNKGKKMEEQTSSILVSVRDGDRYSCSVKGHDLPLTFLSCPPDAPRPPSVSVTPSDDIMEGSLVTLTCSSDANPEANYTWYKEGEEAPKASGRNFTITNIMFKQRGNYSCEAQNSRGRYNS